MRQAFEKRLAEDPEFVASPEARLDFFYRRHPSWDERLNLYPVYRTATRYACIVWYPVLVALLVAGSGWLAAMPRARAQANREAAGPTVSVTLTPGAATGPLDGRLLLLVSTDATAEPRFQIEAGPMTRVLRPLLTYKGF